jgi:hypothetical protein
MKGSRETSVMMKRSALSGSGERIAHLSIVMGLGHRGTGLRYPVDNRKQFCGDAGTQKAIHPSDWGHDLVADIRRERFLSSHVPGLSTAGISGSVFD